MLDVTEEEARKILATHDPLTAIAEADQDTLDDLLDGITTQSEALHEMLKNLRVDTWDIDEAEFPELASIERTTMSTMSFSATNDQKEIILDALQRAKDAEPFVDTGNDNSNGNFIARVCEAYS